MPTILIVDDEEDIRELVSLNLAREGYDLLEAGDGLVALNLARKQCPDLIILDLMLPQKDGFSVFRDLRSDSRTHGIPV
ncbi:MAG: response regulator, partial [Verrucomicrobiales bacterium]